MLINWRQNLRKKILNREKLQSGVSCFRNFLKWFLESKPTEFSLLPSCLMSVYFCSRDLPKEVSWRTVRYSSRSCRIPKTSYLLSLERGENQTEKAFSLIGSALNLPKNQRNFLRIIFGYYLIRFFFFIRPIRPPFGRFGHFEIN